MYEDIKNAVSCAFLVEDGYKGDWTLCRLALVEGIAYEVYDFGAMNSPRLTGKYSSPAEMKTAAENCRYFKAVDEA